MRKTIIAFILSISIFSLATNSEAKQNSLDFDFTSIGFHGFYDLEISEENGQTVARSIYDPADSPHYTYDSETQTWDDNHPGRNDIELLFPPVRVSGRTIWKELAGYEWKEQSKSYIENDLNRAVWNQDMLAYEYINLPHDEGHPVFWLPMMSIDVDGIGDEEKGRVNFAESIESDDFELGVSGVRLDFYISTNHPDIEYWVNKPQELINEYYSIMYLDNFWWLKGRHLQVRWLEEDITSADYIGIMNDREIFFQGDMTARINFAATGYLTIAPSTDIITFSAPHGIKNINAASVPHYICLYTLRIKNDGEFKDEFAYEYRVLFSETTKSILNNLSIQLKDIFSVKVK